MNKEIRLDFISDIKSSRISMKDYKEAIGGIFLVHSEGHCHIQGKGDFCVTHT